VTPDAWRDGGRFFDWRGHRMWCRVDGSGEPMLLVHGFPTASWDYAKIWNRVTARHRAYTLDLIGYGYSAKPRDFAYSILAQADLIEAFLAAEGVTRYRILAHDYGVTVAQELLARSLDTGGNIASVCFLNGGLFPEMHRALPAQKLLASPLGPVMARLMRYPMFAASMKRIWGTHPLADAELRGMWQLVTANGGVHVMPQLISYMAERRLRRERWVGALTRARLPLRLINGLVDPVSGAHAARRYRELVPDPDVVELPGVGHYPQVEAPDAVADAVLGWPAS
jgi:pimeloyl-ACP methyl ester carboxylesterase